MPATSPLPQLLPLGQALPRFHNPVLLRHVHVDKWHHGLSSVPYQRRTVSPKNIQVSAPNARYGPKGSLADQTGFPTTSVTKPITEPRSDPANKLNNTARHPRNAPIAARNFRSPRPIASRGMTSFRVTPEMCVTSSSISTSPLAFTRS